MRKTIIAIVILALVAGLWVLRLHYPQASLINRTGWTLFGEGSEWFWALMQFLIITITLALPRGASLIGGTHAEQSYLFERKMDVKRHGAAKKKGLRSVSEK
jgi:hypothetical protein